MQKKNKTHSPITLTTTVRSLCEHPIRSKDVMKLTCSYVEGTTATGKKPMKDEYAMYIENANIHANEPS